MAKLKIVAMQKEFKNSCRIYKGIKRNNNRDLHTKCKINKNSKSQNIFNEKHKKLTQSKMFISCYGRNFSLLLFIPRKMWRSALQAWLLLCLIEF